MPTPQDVVSSARRWLTLIGILALVAGGLALIVPAAASVATAIFLGWILVFVGIGMTVHAFSHESAGATAMRLLNAALTLFVGIYLLVAPLSGTATLTFVVAAWFFASGGLELLTAVRERGQPGAGFIAVQGALSLLLGLLIAVNLPSSAGWAIGVLVGINLLFWGIRALVVAGALKRVGG